MREVYKLPGEPTKKRLTSRCKISLFLGPPGLGFHASASCLRIPARLRSLSRTSCALFLAPARRSLRFKSRVETLKKKSDDETRMSPHSDTRKREFAQQTLDTLKHGCFKVWAHLDLNQGPTDYESAALTN